MTIYDHLNHYGKEKQKESKGSWVLDPQTEQSSHDLLGNFQNFHGELIKA